MKKIISVLLSIMMVIAVGAVSVIPAMASTITVGSGDSSVTISGSVNGENSNYVIITQNPSYPGQFSFEYTGNEILVDWEFIGLEATDYFVSYKQGNKVTIELSTTGTKKDFTANAITKAKETTTDASGSGTETTAPSKPSAGNTDKGGTSPSTGAAMAGVAVAGAGIAVLALRKKND